MDAIQMGWDFLMILNELVPKIMMFSLNFHMSLSSYCPLLHSSHTFFSKMERMKAI